jgi:hypothetical protein
MDDFALLLFMFTGWGAVCLVFGWLLGRLEPIAPFVLAEKKMLEEKGIDLGTEEGRA